MPRFEFDGVVVAVSSLSLSSCSRFISFFLIRSFFNPLFAQIKNRITLERDGKASEVQVEEGENILQVRRGGEGGGFENRRRRTRVFFPFFLVENLNKKRKIYLQKQQAALDAGIELTHDCKMGVCMTCPAKLVSFFFVDLKGRGKSCFSFFSFLLFSSLFLTSTSKKKMEKNGKKKLSGSVDQSAGMLDEGAIEKGYVLTCVAEPTSDCVLAIIDEDEILEEVLCSSESA